MTDLSVQLPETSRRSVLRALAGLPLLPVAGIGAGELLFASGAEAASAKGAPVAVEFVGMAAPTAAAAQAKTTVESSMVVTWADGSKQSFALGYQPLFITGDPVPDGKGGTILAGGYVDINGKPILDASLATPSQFFSDCPDGCNLLAPIPGAKVAGVTGNTLFAVVQFEYTTRDSKDASMYGKLPSPIAVLTLDQNKETGALKLVQYHNVDTSGVHGLWITCGASLSPWNTHLSSEEYEPDATAPDDQFRAYSKNLFGDETKANPYHYGHLPEVTVNPDGKTVYVSNGKDGTVSVIDTASDKVTATIPVGKRPWNMAITPDGGKLYVANGRSNSVSVIDTATKQKIRDVAVGELPWGVVIQ